MDIFSLLDAIQTIARNGLTFAVDEYDHERYVHLLDLTIQAYSELLAAPDELVRQRFLDELGYITPKVGADAAIFNENGEILLMDRVDGSGWCLPCGFVEPNEKPTDAAVREAWEETGLEVEVQQLVGVFTRLPGVNTNPHTTIAVVHLCTVCGGELRLSHEGLGLRYWSIAEVPRWHAIHQRYAQAAHAVWKAGRVIPAISD